MRTASLLVGVLLLLAAPAWAGVMDVLFVVSGFSGTTPTDSRDVPYITHLGHLGCTVTLWDDDNDPRPSALLDKELVLISDSVGSTKPWDTYYLGTTVGLICIEGNAYDLLEMTHPGEAKGTNPTDTVVTITSFGASHPLGADLPVGNATVLPSAQQMIEVVIAGNFPAGYSKVVATNPAGDCARTFLYDKGDTLPDGSTAAGIRIGFPLTRYSTGTLNDTGWDLFDHAVQYAIPEPATLALLGLGALGLAIRRKRG
jgi:hypothetical protein